MSSISPFNQLVKLFGRAFYNDITTTSEKKQTKSCRKDDRGVAVVVLDALTRRQWVREENLAKDLKLHTKQLRRVLILFEEEKLITREHRKETGREGAEKLKMHTQSYCCLDYSQIYDVARYRLHRMRKMVKDEIESKNKVQEYICPSCSKRYTALDAPRLMSPYDGDFHCESCDGILVAESDKLAAQDLGGRDAKARRCRQEKLKNMLRKMEDQLKPLTDQIGIVKDLAVPEFGSLRAWEVRANTAVRANGNCNYNDSSTYPQIHKGNTQVEVTFSCEDDKGDVETIKSTNDPAKKPMPPWMISNKPDAVDVADVSELSMQESPNVAVFKERQVGAKSKRHDDVDEKKKPPATGNTPEHSKVDMNKEAQSSEDEDDIDWEDG